MQRSPQATPNAGASISLRLIVFFVGLLVIATLTVGYLFDRGRSEALRQQQLEQLHLHAERAADEVAGLIGRLRSDVLFLAGTPPIAGIERATRGGGIDRAGHSSLDQWIARLTQILLAFAEARPQYFQLRLIGAGGDGRELVRIERDAQGLRVTPPTALQRKRDRYYFQEAAGVESGWVYLSRIDLNREHGQISVPHQPTLRAATPVYAADGSLFGVVVVNMDMAWVLKRAETFGAPGESLHIVDEHGGFLPQSWDAVPSSLALGAPFALHDAFPGVAERGHFLDLPDDKGGRVGYLTVRGYDPVDPERRLIFIVTEPVQRLLQSVGLVRIESVLGMATLLLLATVLVVIMVRRQTRSLAALVKASDAIAAGDYPVQLPVADSGEIGSLVRAFREMSAQVEQREEALAELNRSLEERVETRTRELGRQHDLQTLILDSIGDGVVVVDRDGRFLLWNTNAEQIVGSGPEPVLPPQWASHFGIYTGESGELVPVDELPLVRAIRGEPMVNSELYLRHPECLDGVWVQVTARPLRDSDGEISGAVAVLIDRSEQRRLQEQVHGHRNELVTLGRALLGAEIASTAAHQLSQPITAMSNYASAAARLLALGQLQEADLKDMLGRIEQLAVQAGEILGKLRSRIRRREPQRVVFDPNRVAASCLDVSGDRIDRLGVRVERDFATGLPALLGDPMELEHALVQLIANALEAMEGLGDGERRLCLRTGYDEDSGLVTLAVGDTGRGVSPSIAARVFEPWETDKPGALGIGLSIAQTIVEGLGGRIRCQPNPAGGTLFLVDLPAQGGREA